ncbi:MAG: hypothetical protein K0Q74_194 [Gammaproteobacteria bacterium]|jgi:hypothetical protein|nr:hypothetical protein [Gammaproteobacteria bacterium]
MNELRNEQEPEQRRNRGFHLFKLLPLAAIIGAVFYQFRRIDDVNVLPSCPSTTEVSSSLWDIKQLLAKDNIDSLQKAIAKSDELIENCAEPNILKQRANDKDWKNAWENLAEAYISQGTKFLKRAKKTKEASSAVDLYSLSIKSYEEALKLADEFDVMNIKYKKIVYSQFTEILNVAPPTGEVIRIARKLFKRNYNKRLKLAPYLLEAKTAASIAMFHFHRSAYIDAKLSPDVSEQMRIFYEAWNTAKIIFKEYSLNKENEFPFEERQEINSFLELVKKSETQMNLKKVFLIIAEEKGVNLPNDINKILRFAIRYDLEELKWLLEIGRDSPGKAIDIHERITVIDQTGALVHEPLLNVAVICGKTNAIKILWDLNVNINFEDSRALLGFAAQSGNIDSVKFIFGKMKQIYYTENKINTIIHGNIKIPIDDVNVFRAMIELAYKTKNYQFQDFLRNEIANYKQMTQHKEVRAVLEKIIQEIVKEGSITDLSHIATDLSWPRLVNNVALPKIKNLLNTLASPNIFGEQRRMRSIKLAKLVEYEQEIDSDEQRHVARLKQ